MFDWDNLTEEPKTKAPAVRDPLDPAPLLTGFAAYEPQITDMEDEVKAVTVTDDQSAARCTEMAGQCRRMALDIDKARKAAIAPYEHVTGTINKTCKPWADRLKLMQSQLESKNRYFLIEQERKRKAAEQEAREEADRIMREAKAKAKAAAEAKAAELNIPIEQVKVEPAFVPSVSYVPPDRTEIRTSSGHGMGLVPDMQWEIVNFRVLPEECLQEREKEIKAAIAPWLNAQKRAKIFNHPGVVWVKTEVPKTRVGR